MLRPGPEETSWRQERQRSRRELLRLRAQLLQILTMLNNIMRK